MVAQADVLGPLLAAGESSHLARLPRSAIDLDADSLFDFGLQRLFGRWAALVRP
ncbi:hypothetical protein ACQPZK_30265 [Micromonospora sp. CA-249363]|uniref:hypothetical protein n=1 Tax=Micromonospora sp. CA-249363 TaxID=3239963 RepID=UPI003D8BCA2F